MGIVKQMQLEEMYREEQAALQSARAELRAESDESSPLECELRALLNRMSAERGSNTPDYILARYLFACLAAFDSAVEERGRWYSPDEKE